MRPKYFIVAPTSIRTPLTRKWSPKGPFGGRLSPGPMKPQSLGFVQCHPQSQLLDSSNEQCHVNGGQYWSKYSLEALSVCRPRSRTTPRPGRRAPRKILSYLMFHKSDRPLRNITLYPSSMDISVLPGEGYPPSFEIGPNNTPEVGRRTVIDKCLPDPRPRQGVKRVGDVQRHCQCHFAMASSERARTRKIVLIVPPESCIGNQSSRGLHFSSARQGGQRLRIQRVCPPRRVDISGICIYPVLTHNIIMYLFNID